MSDKKYLDYSGLKKLGSHGVIEDDALKGVPDQVIYVSDETELTSLPEDLPAGTIAIQYGLSNIWQLDTEGTWIEV